MIIIQGDIVRIKNMKKYNGRIGEIVGYNPLYKEYEVKLLTSEEIIYCSRKNLFKLEI
ncbi:MAG: hypothetical protein ACTSQP_18825 [Promethearchaeota archaeon]